MGRVSAESGGGASEGELSNRGGERGRLALGTSVSLSQRRGLPEPRGRALQMTGVGCTTWGLPLSGGGPCFPGPRVGTLIGGAARSPGRIQDCPEVQGTWRNVTRPGHRWWRQGTDRARGPRTRVGTVGPGSSSAMPLPLGQSPMKTEGPCRVCGGPEHGVGGVGGRPRASGSLMLSGCPGRGTGVLWATPEDRTGRGLRRETCLFSDGAMGCAVRW